MNIADPGQAMLQSLEKCCGFDSYRKTLDKSSIATSDYQKNFTNYYRVRHDAEKPLIF